jgi:hypothetical protein
MLSLDAIIRSLVRRFITGQRLLEWETAAEAENAAQRTTPVDRYLAITPVFAIILAVVILAVSPKTLLVAAPVLLLWGFSGGITYWLNQPPREQKQRLTADEDTFLRQQALRIWRYFYEFGGESHNYLIPDNVEEEGLFEAARVSPTNLGLLLNARQAACEFGFLTVPEFATLSHASLATFARLEKSHGHLYNWYNTRTLEPLKPITVSSVDSGNLAASLYTLRMGAQFLLREPVLSKRLFRGLHTHWQLLKLQIPDAAKKQIAAPPADKAGIDTWIAWLLETAETSWPEPLASGAAEQPGELEWWTKELRLRITSLQTLLQEYMPWLLPEFASLRALPQIGLRDDSMFPSLETAAEFAEHLDLRLARAWATREDSANVFASEKLRSLLPIAKERLRSLAQSLQEISDEAYRLADEMDFGFLLQKGRMLLSIGYEVEPKKLHTACYDLLASEARIAAFVAIAKGDISQQVWFKLARTHTMAFGRSLLLSWTGTMFEYLMPSLWMRSYPDTLVSRTLNATVAIQRAFAREKRIPWGISESGYAQKTDDGHYHYQAFGIPQVSLKWDATAGPVVSPYSTFLALGVDVTEALRNLRRMAGHGWIGAYGFYEAIDYSLSSSQPQLVREWMAHHQGMSLLAILNLLDDNIVQQWFHASPQLQATELLLHEKPVSEAALKAEYKRFAPRRVKIASLKKAS